MYIHYSGVKAATIHSKAVAAGYNLRPIDDHHVGLSFDESHGNEDVSQILNIFGADGSSKNIESLVAQTSKTSVIPSALQRTSKFLTHPVFNTHRSETQMLRYLKYLEVKCQPLE